MASQLRDWENLSYIDAALIAVRFFEAAVAEKVLQLS
jgi:hypothetical protein